MHFYVEQSVAIHVFPYGKTPKLQNVYVHLSLVLHCAMHVWKRFLRLLRIATRSNKSW